MDYAAHARVLTLRGSLPYAQTVGGRWNMDYSTLAKALANLPELEAFGINSHHYSWARLKQADTSPISATFGDHSEIAYQILENSKRVKAENGNVVALHAAWPWGARWARDFARYSYLDNRSCCPELDHCPAW